MFSFDPTDDGSSKREYFIMIGFSMSSWDLFEEKSSGLGTKVSVKMVFGKDRLDFVNWAGLDIKSFCARM
jgi:hypothetical protein